MDSTKKSKDVAVCECCKRPMRHSKLSVHYTLASMLVKLYSLGPDYHHINDFRPEKHSSGRDFSILKHWGLIRPMPNTKDHKSSGKYKLSMRGIAFVTGNVAIPKNVMVFNNEVTEVSAEFVTIYDCLSTPFVFAEVLGENAG